MFFSRALKKLIQIKWWVGCFVVTVLAVCVGIYTWSYWPISARPQDPDPAVKTANELSSGEATFIEGYVESRGNQIHYITAGEGDPIVFLHGFPSYWFSMFKLMDAFSSTHKVIAIDGLGVGRSSAPAALGEYKISGLVADVENVLNRLELNQAHLVGHDWGSVVATAFAQSDPNRIRTLTVIGALPLNVVLERLESDQEHREIFSYVDTFKSANPALITLLGAADDVWEAVYSPLYEKGFMSTAHAEQMRADLGDARRLDRFLNWYRANFPQMDSIDDTDFWPRRGTRIGVPMLFIYGTEDRVVTEPLVADLKQSADAIEVLRFEGVEHRPHFEKYDEVVNAISKLIENN